MRRRRMEKIIMDRFVGSKNFIQLPSVSLIRPQRSQEFQSGTGRDFAKSQDPGIFRDEINLMFSSRD